MAKFLFILFLLIVGCASPAIIHEQTINRVDGSSVHSRTEITAPQDATEPATLFIQPIEDGTPQSLSASTGAGTGIDQSLAALSSSANWLAIILILAGVGSLIARVWIKVIPVTASVILLGSGGLLLMAPVLLDRFALYIFVGIAVAGALWLWGWFDNRKKLRAIPDAMIETKTKEETA